MKEPVAIEYLCYGCGTQGLTRAPEGTFSGADDGLALKCPNCGRVVYISGFHPVPAAINPVQAVLIR